MDELRFIPINTEDSDPGVFVQGIHVPARLVEESGVWIREAGSAILTQDQYQIAPFYHTLWLVADEGDMTMTFGNQRLRFKKGECFVIPAGTTDCRLEEARDSCLLWFTVDGTLATSFLRQMNAHNLVPARQGILPNQVLLIRQIVQVLVRHSGTDQASFQLAQLLWALLAAHSGHSVATNAVLSHEIARVVDAMRQSQYQANFSLAEMAAISRMPMETFRKRFTTELGIPPLGYLQFQKMERAKTLLRGGMSVRQTGVEIGMPDPYHFSKQFKHIVGMSPTAYLKHVGPMEPDGRA